VGIIGSWAENIGELRIDPELAYSGKDIQRILSKEGMTLVSLGNGSELDFCKRNFGFVKDQKLMKLYQSLDSIIVPTSWGWGFKTKIADALFNNQRVYVSASLGKRYGTWVPALEVVNNWSQFSWSPDSNRSRKIRSRVMSFQLRARKECLDEIFRAIDFVG
jgi:hypothetical protein